jgi:hypothetical protein
MTKLICEIDRSQENTVFVTFRDSGTAIFSVDVHLEGLGVYDTFDGREARHEIKLDESRKNSPLHLSLFAQSLLPSHPSDVETVALELSPVDEPNEYGEFYAYGNILVRKKSGATIYKSAACSFDY